MTAVSTSEADLCEHLYAELKKLEAVGAVEYVLPTVPLGEEWIVGFEGSIIKMIGNGEAAAFLAGVNVACRTLARHAGLSIPGLGTE